MSKTFISKKVMIMIFAVIFLISTVSFSHANLQSKLNQPSYDKFGEIGQINMKNWTFMLYDDADFLRAFDPLNWFSEEAYSTGNLNTIVLQDKERGPAKIWYIEENHQKTLVQKMEEINMGDASTLQNFIEFCKSNYTANRYILALYDHGMGWYGACIDETNDDYLTMDEIQQAINATGGVDIVCFTAPCRMGAVESAYELKDCTDLYIGSEEGSGYVWWGDIIGEICDSLNDSPNQSIIEFGIDVIDLIYENSYEWPEWKADLTMSAIQTNKLNRLVDAINELSIDFIENYEELYENITIAYENTISFGYGYGIDIYDFTNECLQVFSNETLIKKLNNVQKNVSDAVIAECHGENKSDAQGLSIYFPDQDSPWWSYDISYSFCNLDFTENTYWDEFLIKYLNISNETTIVYILKPTNGLYLKNNKIFTPFIKMILGDIEIKVAAADLDGIERVEFFINNQNKHIDTTYPYSWIWEKKLPFRFRNVIKVIAYDNKGNSAYNKVTVIRIF